MGKPPLKRKSKYNAAQKQGKKSNLEVTCDKLLREAGILFDYEPRSYELLPKFNFCFYDGVKGIMKQKCIGRNMVYTPDFVCPDQTWFIETKGMSTPDFQMRWKLFRHWCSTNLPEALLIIAHNQKEIAEAITLIQSHIKKNKDAL